MPKGINKSAGIGDPYWYEWGIGLLKAVEMLNPDSGIDAVAFQKEGIKGWDDVVIRYLSGRIDYYQVKHSAPKTNLTFSDIVGKSEDQLSLLGSLTSSWYEMNLFDSDASCILITNRNAGKKAGRSGTGVFYPPLHDFLSHISTEVTSAFKLSDITVQEQWGDAWKIWLSEMGNISDDLKLKFLKELKVLDHAPELEEMRDQLADLLASYFQINNLQAQSLIKSLLAALFEWTTTLRGNKEWITAEAMMAAMSESDYENFGVCDVPTPAPFFPSRAQTVMTISKILMGKDNHKIVFLEAEPGAGKTSVVSKIVNKRSEDNSTLIVDLRYYTYKPITPDAPALPVDADRSASPRSLWYSLLSQIRERLQGRLIEQKVPVRNNFVSPDDARDHVLRLSAVLAQEKGSPFVIVIDGIDHAARANRKGLPSLLASLPSPEMVPTGVRFMIAGQPSSAYPEYPLWLRSKNAMVVRVVIGPVDAHDVEILLAHSKTEIPQEDHEHVVRIVQGAAAGNTLATVFAVAEAESCVTLAELDTRLSEKLLHSGVQEYYTKIWRAAVPESPAGLGPYLSFVLSILRERVTGEMMHNAFSQWNISIPEWNDILKKLEPLVVCDPDGFRVRHNDIRVFLEQELRSDEASMQNIASLLSDYYMGASANPFFRQVSLFKLFELAGRELDKAKVFNPKWVLNAAAYGQDLSVLYQEAEEAFRAIPEARDWNIALSVACGGMTLNKLSDCVDAYPEVLDGVNRSQLYLPHCLETERFVPPITQWNISIIQQVLDDVKKIADRKEVNRARGLMENWFKGITPSKVISEVNGFIEDRVHDDDKRISTDAETIFEDWGRLVFRLKLEVSIDDPSDDIQHQASYYFENGWTSECITTSESENVLSSLKAFNLRYLRTYENATEIAANKALWVVVNSLLKSIEHERERLSLEFRVKALYWALKAAGNNKENEWGKVLSEVRLGKLNGNYIEMSLMIFVAKSIGWLEIYRDTDAIASELTEALAGKKRTTGDRSALFLPLQVATMIGKVERLLLEKDLKNLSVLASAAAMQKVIEVIWESQYSDHFIENRILALNLTFELIELCTDIGGSYGEMVLSIAIKETEKYPVDQKMEILWEVLRCSGQKNRLRAWAEHWIGQEGAVWSGNGYSERAEIVSKLSSLCRAEGWGQLADFAEDRLRHRIIGYSSHKEYSFKEPFEWIVELLRYDPRAWHTEGIQLLNLCRECSDQGGDNRLSFKINNEVAAAAFRCGADNAYAFFNWIDPEIERYWLQSIRSTLILAGSRAIEERYINGLPDVLAVWCCAVGLTRWFNKSQAKELTSLRDEILKTANREDIDKLLHYLKTITPGEFLREEYEKDQDGSKASKNEEAFMCSSCDLTCTISKFVENIDEDTETRLWNIFRLSLYVAKENPANRAELMDTLFGLVNTNRRYSYSWDYRGQLHPLKELIAFIREDEIWNLMRAAIQTSGESYWLYSIPHNVHLICLYLAAAEGIDSLRTGTQSLFEMHRLWSGLSDCEANSRCDKNSDSGVDTWSGFAANILCRLLCSDSAETVTAALRGLCALVEIAPRAVSSLFTGIDGVQRSRLLIGAEVWAARQPQYFASIIDGVWKERKGLSLEDRIQLWICKIVAQQQLASIDFVSSFISYTQAESTARRFKVIMTKPKRLMEIAPEMQGCVPIANIFSISRNWLSRFRLITGGDTDDLENIIAEEIITRNDEFLEYSSSKKVKGFAIEDGDMTITAHRLDSILNKALEQELCKSIWNDENAGDVAMAVMPGDDPWVFRHSPLPSPKNFVWPDQKEVEEWLETNADNNNVQDKLKLLVMGADLPANQQVLGSYLRLFTSHYDCEMWYWLENLAEGNVMAKRAPICPSSRSFQIILPDRFEPYSVSGYPLVFFSRSILRLSFSTLEIVPARILEEQLGWYPQPINPLVWLKGSQVVAKYETYHGPLEYNWSRRNMRQSTLSRWVVDAEELQQLGDLCSKWDFEVHQFSEK